MAIIIPASLLFDEDGNEEVLEAGDEQQIQDENDSGNEITEDEALEIIAEAAEDMTEEDVQELSEGEIQEGFDFLELSEDEMNELEGDTREFADGSYNDKDIQWITVNGRRIPIKKKGMGLGAKIGAGAGILGAGLAAAYALKKGKMGQVGEQLSKMGKLKAFAGEARKRALDKATAIRGGMGNFASRAEFMGKYGLSKAKGVGREVSGKAKLLGQDIVAGAKNVSKNVRAGAKVIAKSVPSPNSIGKSAALGVAGAGSMGYGINEYRKSKQKRYSEDNIIIPYSSLMLSDMFSGEQIDDIVLSALHALAPGVNFSEDKPWENVEIEQDENGEICSVAFGENYIDAEGMKAIGFSLMDNAGSYQFAFNKKQFEPIGNEGEENEMPDDEELEQEPATFKKKKKKMMMMKGEMNKEGQEEMELCGSKKMKMKK